MHFNSRIFISFIPSRAEWNKHTHRVLKITKAWQVSALFTGEMDATLVNKLFEFCVCVCVCVKNENDKSEKTIYYINIYLRSFTLFCRCYRPLK